MAAQRLIEKSCCQRQDIVTASSAIASRLRTSSRSRLPRYASPQFGRQKVTDLVTNTAVDVVVKVVIKVIAIQAGCRPPMAEIQFSASYNSLPLFQERRR